VKSLIYLSLQSMHLIIFHGFEFVVLQDGFCELRNALAFFNVVAVCLPYKQSTSYFRV